MHTDSASLNGNTDHFAQIGAVRTETVKYERILSELLPDNDVDGHMPLNRIQDHSYFDQSIVTSMKNAAH